MGLWAAQVEGTSSITALVEAVGLPNNKILLYVQSICKS